MKVSVDTNVLARAITEDEPRQSKVAQDLLRSAELVAIGTYALCELVWVLTKVYRFRQSEIANAIEKLTNGDNVAVDRRAVRLGLHALSNGGDFADGAIALEGRTLGGETFVSLDKRAVAMLKAAGEDAELL